jgi:hypothetical protein
VIVSLAEAAVAAAGKAGLAAWLLAVVVITYLGMRFLLAAPASFVESRLAFASSWRLTRGRVWALLGMTVLTVCLIALLWVTVSVVLAILAAVVGGLDGIESVFRRNAEGLQRHPLLFGLYAAVQVILVPVVWTLAGAPLIHAYRALISPPTQP